MRTAASGQIAAHLANMPPPAQSWEEGEKTRAELRRRLARFCGDHNALYRWRARREIWEGMAAEARRVGAPMPSPMPPCPPHWADKLPEDLRRRVMEACSPPSVLPPDASMGSECISLGADWVREMMPGSKLNRRDALFIASATLATAALAPDASAQRRRSAWRPYRRTISIDGAGGLSLGWLELDDPGVAADLAAARASGLRGIVLTLAPQGQFWMDDAAIARVHATIEKWNTIIELHPEHLLLVRSGADLIRARDESKLGIIYTFQGAEPLGEDVDRVPMYRELGVRVIQLTHNRRNLVGDGCMESGNAGLSNFGHKVVERLNAEKMVVDLAHGSARTIVEGIAASSAPPLISHTGCRALADHPRNVDDATLRALAEKGGVAGIIFWPYLRVDTQPMAIDVIQHIEHAINVCGEDHVGIGTDAGVAPIDRTPEFETENRDWVAYAVDDGIFQRGRPADLYTFIPDLNNADRFDTLAGMLSRRGHSDARIAKVLGENFARVMTDVWG